MFQLKREYVPSGKFEIKIRRSHILEDSYQHIMSPKLKPENLKSKLWIAFDGEIGLDYGGVARCDFQE